MDALLEWAGRSERKPLVIMGARQVGKTWVMKKLGREAFKYTAYFNFDASEELCREFENTKNPERLLDILRLYSEDPIEPGKTLIIFDEIQQSNKALNSLKYFREDAPGYHIIAAGSLLGVALSHGDSFPVGAVEFKQMYPVTFREFLRVDNPKMFDFLENLKEIGPLPEIVMGQVGEAYRRYQVCGGMPEAVDAMLENKSAAKVREAQEGVLTSYSLDFGKHAPAKEIPRITAVWKSIPSQLARENRKFVYKIVKSDARAREYEGALLWLEQAGLIHRVFRSSKPGLPLSAYDDLSAFKVYLSDVGLLRVMATLPAEAMWSDNPLYREFKGALAENVVLQSLVANFEVRPRYWTSAASAEVDFILQHETSVLPVEVKAGTNIGGKSLGVYFKRYSPGLALRYSMNNLRIENSILDIPLFLADWTKSLLALVLRESDEMTLAAMK